MDHEFESRQIAHPIDIERARARVMAHVRADSRVRRSTAVFRYAGIAASIVLAVVASYGWLAGGHPQTGPAKTFSTTLGQRANVKLVDGSSVILAPMSTMHVTGRTVELSGEAIFSVNEHSAEPFIVRANNTDSRVLGTHFSVKAYANDRSVRVAVSEGKVAFAETVLSAGEVGRIGADGIKTVDTESNIDDLFSWTEGRHVFRRAPLKDVIADLERWYSVQIVVPQSLVATEFTGVLSGSASDEAISTLAASLGVKVKYEGNSVRFLLP